MYYFSGGTRVTIAGSNLHIVQEPQLGILLPTGDEAFQVSK